MSRVITIVSGDQHKPAKLRMDKFSMTAFATWYVDEPARSKSATNWRILRGT
jgi:hypothetical protein